MGDERFLRQESWDIQHSIRRINIVCLVVFLIPEKEIVKDYVNLITVCDIIRVRIYYSVLRHALEVSYDTFRKKRHALGLEKSIAQGTENVFIAV